MSNLFPRVFIFLLCIMGPLVTQTQAKFVPNPVSIQTGAPTTHLYQFCLQDCFTANHPVTECLNTCKVGE